MGSIYYLHLFLLRFTMNHLESEIQPIKYLVDLCIDAIFLSHKDVCFRHMVRSMGLGGLFHIPLPCTFQQYAMFYDRTCYQRLSKIIRFKSNVVEFVQNNKTLLEEKMSKIANLYIALNK